MFTGIIEEIGFIQQIQRTSQIGALTIAASRVLVNSNMGDSLAVSGVCLTITRVTHDCVTADISAETLRRTTLGELQVGAAVNLERPLRLNDRLGGHLVLGHVDEVGIISGWEEEGTSSLMRVSISPDTMRYVVHKGSICVDGVSLTIANLFDDSFAVSLIPHTKGVTTLGRKRVGDRVNIEVDLLGRYIERLLTRQGPAFGGHPQETSIDLAFLKEHGYLV